MSEVQVRGNVVCLATGKGLKGAVISITGNTSGNYLQFISGKYGLFLFELDNSESYKLVVESGCYVSKEEDIPQGFNHLYTPILLKFKEDNSALSAS